LILYGKLYTVTIFEWNFIILRTRQGRFKLIQTLKMLILKLASNGKLSQMIQLLEKELK
jgi:hypothetical protein